MVPILDGNLEKGARVMTNLFKAFDTIVSSHQSPFSTKCSESPGSRRHPYAHDIGNRDGPNHGTYIGW